MHRTCNRRRAVLPLLGTRFRLLTALTALVLLGACSESGVADLPTLPITKQLIQQLNAPAERVSATNATHTRTIYDYQLGAGDVLEFKIWENPSEDSSNGVVPVIHIQIVRVESDGGAHFPHAGNVNVMGKTLAQTRALVTAKLSKYYRNPQFDLQVQEFHGQKITVSGAVAKPGLQTLNYEALTLNKALEMAGGPTPAGDISNAVIIHRDGSRETVNLLDLLYHGDTTQDRVLFPDDTVLIPESHRNKVFLMGEVSKPSAYTISAGHLSLTEALNEAQGLNSLTASPRRIYVIRNAISHAVMDTYENGEPSDTTVAENAAYNATIYHLDASNPAAYALADQFALQPRDIVYVSLAPITQWHRFISQLIPSAISYSPSVNQ